MPLPIQARETDKWHRDFNVDNCSEIEVLFRSRHRLQFCAGSQSHGDHVVLPEIIVANHNPAPAGIIVANGKPQELRSHQHIHRPVRWLRECEAPDLGCYRASQCLSWQKVGFP